MTMPAATTTDLDGAVDRLPVAILLAASPSSLTGSEVVKATVGKEFNAESSGATTTAADAGGRSGVRVLC